MNNEPGQASEWRLGSRGLKVLAFTDYLSIDSCGGAERVAREVYRRFRDADVDVRVVTATPFAESSDHGDAAGAGLVDGIPVERVRALDLSRITGAQVCLAPPALVRRTLRLAREFQPDVLHANSLYFQTSLVAAICQRVTGVPMVTTAHIGSPEQLRLPIRLATSAYANTLGRFILSRSERVIAVAPSVVEHVRGLGVSRDKVKVVANGVDQARFFPVVERAALEGPPLILFVGRLIENKGPMLLIEALEILRAEGKQVRAAFVGDGPLRSDLAARLSASGLDSSVTLVGQSSDVAGWLAEASVIVRPSFTEGMPLTVLEGMASGVLCVVSDIPGNSDLIQDGINGLTFPAGNAQELANRLRFAVEQPEEAGRLAAAGHRSSTAYSWEACAAATFEVLGQAADAG